jgi:two-component system, NarL family, sensor histidine kinase UhpB
MKPQSAPVDAPTQDIMVQPQAIHAALEGMVTIDQQMRIIMINPAAQRMFGRAASEAIGLPLDELLPARYRESHRVHVQRFFDSDQVERPMGSPTQLFGLRANGEEFPLQAAICKVELATEGGLKLCCTALLYDRSTEQALSNVIDTLNQQMRVVFERAPVAIWITDGDRIAFANKACSRLFGVDAPEELIGQQIHHLLSVDPHDSGLEWSLLLPAAGADDVKLMSGKVARPDGMDREVEIAVTPLPDHGQRFVQMVIVDTTLRTRERRSLLDSRRTLRALSASIVDAREEERQRIARELHDELGQRLTALKMELSAHQRRMPGGAESVESEDLQRMLDMVDETVAATRRIALGLRPPMLDDLGLEAAIEWLVSDFRDRNPIQVELQMESVAEAVSPAVSIALYRILQEALTNITRHAGAQQVRIGLTLRGRWMRLEVQDDGQGFPKEGPSTRRGSFGLIGMRERVRMLGGQLQVTNHPQGGACLVVRLPLMTNEDAQSRLFMDEAAPAPDTSPSPLTPWVIP